MASDVSQRARDCTRDITDILAPYSAPEMEMIVRIVARFEAEIRADEREQIQIWLNACSGSFRATTVAAAIAALEHKDTIRKGPTP